MTGSRWALSASAPMASSVFPVVRIPIPESASALPMPAFIACRRTRERMRPLTDHTPKPLLQAGEAAHRLAPGTAGQRRISRRRDQSRPSRPADRSCPGRRQALGLNIRFSPEPPGAWRPPAASPTPCRFSGTEAFLVINGDIWCDWDVRRAHCLSDRLAHLVLVANPPIMPAAIFPDRRSGPALPAVAKPSPTGIGIFFPRPSFKTCGPDRY